MDYGHIACTLGTVHILWAWYMYYIDSTCTLFGVRIQYHEQGVARIALVGSIVIVGRHTPALHSTASEFWNSWKRRRELFRSSLHIGKTAFGDVFNLGCPFSSHNGKQTSAACSAALESWKCWNSESGGLSFEIAC